MLCIVPSVTLALTGFGSTELRYASGLFNLMRNLGGAIGIAVVNTWLLEYARIGVARFGEALGNNASGATAMVTELAHRAGSLIPDTAQAELLARKLFVGLVTQESLTLAFDNVFRLMSWMFLAALIMVPFCRPLPPAAATPAEAH
jgi:DHA2 family multidrug resistance protein